MQPLEALIDRVDPAWPLVERWLSQGVSDVVLVERDAASSDATLLHMQVSTHSILGAMAYECAGMVIDSRVRLLGGGSPQVKSSLRSWNGRADDLMPIERGLVRVGFDVFGGVFALDGGALGSGDGAVHYFAPDTIAWEALGVQYSAWVHWLITEPAKVTKFYEAYEWNGWKLDLSRLKFDEGMQLTPPLWSPAHEKLVQVTRRPAPAHEVVKDLLDAGRKKN